ncbi:MAG: preprotein translocase subunit SecA [Deltaproteobacteria bacterium]|nr:MAG: preprotein translocase subunit SecA [Deltaproteobacteria bacterium]
MVKIGRNEKCPCGSGKKYKHCCSGKQEYRPLTAEEKAKVTLMDAVEKVVKAAVGGEELLIELGVFILYSSRKGDAWLFDLTDCDCVRLAEEGRQLGTVINESPETIEIDWSHTFDFRDKKMFITTYADRFESELADVPSKQIHAARRRIMKKFTKQQLDSIHISAERLG